VKDLGSTNGTFVNGKRVTTAELRDGDKLSVGRLELIVSRSD
jgi:pSer/pThr/pTyr-binding forkhead associated (FHA) protein